MNEYVRYFLIMVGISFATIMLAFSILGFLFVIGVDMGNECVTDDFDCRLCRECHQVAPTQFEQELNEFYEDCNDSPRVSNWNSVQITKNETEVTKWTATRINKSDEKRLYSWPDQKDELMKDYIKDIYEIKHYTKIITINHSICMIDEDLYNFPIYVHLNSSNFNFTNLNTEVKFTLIDNETMLNYNGHMDITEADFYVYVPVVSATEDTQIVMHYTKTINNELMKDE